MKKITCFLLLLISAQLGRAQFVARMELKEPVQGLCTNDVYALLPFDGQKEAVCQTSKAEIEKQLNEQVTYFRDSVNYEDKGMVSLIINCKGEMVKCAIDNKSRHKELDEQIVAVFATLTKWTPGKIKKNTVDSVKLWRFEIKNGKISIS